MLTFLILNKIVSTKTNTILLAAILVAGTIAGFSPSFIIGAAAQSEPYYDRMDDRYSNYEPEPEYPPQYAEKEYNNYEHPEYGSYEQPEYPSYKPDYKPSYGKDNYKSKDSVSIKKLNCINTNFINIGNINGSINTIAPDRTADSEGDLSTGSLGWNEEGYDNGYNKQKDKGFTCIINNNINTTIGGGNATTPEMPLSCLECFEKFLTAAELELIVKGFGIEFLSELCIDLELGLEQESQIIGFLQNLDVDAPRIALIKECLLEAGILFYPETSGFNAQGERGSLASFDVKDGGTGDLSALEKTTKLKQQWLNLLQ